MILIMMVCSLLTIIDLSTFLIAGTLCPFPLDDNVIIRVNIRMRRIILALRFRSSLTLTASSPAATTTVPS